MFDLVLLEEAQREWSELAVQSGQVGTTPGDDFPLWLFWVIVAILVTSLAVAFFVPSVIPFSQVTTG